MTDRLDEALADVLRALQQAPQEGFDVARVESAIKAASRVDRSASKPLSKLFKDFPRPSPSLLLQYCIENPKFTALKEPAQRLLSNGVITEPFFVRVAAQAQPKRAVWSVLVSEEERRIYAGESNGKLSVWSVETGEHLEDLEVCSTVITHVVRAGEGLRVLDAGGTVYQADSGGKRFEEVHAAPEGELHALMGPWLLCWVRNDERELQRLRWFNLETMTEREVTFAKPWRGWLPVVDRGQVLVAFPQAIEALSLETGAHQGTISLPPGHTFERLHADDAGALYLTLDRGGTSVRAKVELDRSSVTLLEDVGPRDEAWALWRRPAHWLEPGRTFLPAGTGELRSANGELVTEYVIDEDHNQLTSAVHRGTGRLIVAGKNIAMPLLVLERYTGEARVPTSAAAAPVRWATPGAQLIVTIGDFDAEDRFHVRVLEAGPGLSLELTREGSPAVRVTHERVALESASVFTRYIQEFDFAPDARIENALPPFLISRDAFGALKSGGRLRYRSPWLEDEAVILDGAVASTISVEVQGIPQVVPTLVAENDNVRLVILDDPEWPLLLEREELGGECRVKVEHFA